MKYRSLSVNLIPLSLNITFLSKLQRRQSGGELKIFTSHSYFIKFINHEQHCHDSRVFFA
ncbi:hypothetical protein VCHA53O466_50080 [Vibrio chagasii]|nr:hypothetical protein VCHA53O466_50080 [Vibrio chagasii]